MVGDDMPKKGVSSSSCDLNLTFGGPLYLHPNDTGGSLIVTIKLTGTENYKVWSIAMIFALRNHNKIGFIDGSCEKDNNNPALINQWDMCNSVVFAWILNSLSSDLYAGAIYPKYAFELWNDLKDTYDKVDGSVVFNLHKSINFLNQSGASLIDYYNKLNSLWKRFDVMFLMGLDDNYLAIRSNILTREPLPLVKVTFAIVSGEESHRNITSVGATKPTATALCFELVGYPVGYVKRNFNPKSVSSNNTSADIHSNNASSNTASNSRVSLSNEQLARLMNLLNDNRVSTSNANMTALITKIGDLKINNDITLYNVLVVLKYTVSLLSVHKLSRDTKFFVGFDKSNCYIQDLKANMTVGIGKQFNGLYLFDFDNACKIISNNCISTCFVFKTLWDQRLGHPADQAAVCLIDRRRFEEKKAAVGKQAVIHRVVNTYGVLRMKENEVNALKENGSQLHDEILHEHQIKSSVKMQSQDIQINPVQAMDDSLIVSKGSLIEPENNNAFSKSEIETHMQRQEEKVDMREAVDAGLVVTESSGTKPDKQDTSSSLWNYITQAVDAYIGTKSHLLRGGEIDQDALLNVELLKTKDMVCMEVYNELSKRFLQLEKHCISLEISIQQKEESFHSNKPCKNKEYPEFRKFFVINDLKAQLQAKTTLICDLKNQIKSVKEASNEAKVKNDIDVIKTINIELEYSVAKLLAANKQLHKEKEHLKQTYKELYNTIKKTRVQNKDNSDSLISQINQKSVENADLKAQIQEKVFANAALKNELRKLKGNIVDSKFAKASILGKPPLQPSRNHLVVRQPNAFTSERPRMSRPRFASQVDEKNDLSKTVTPHYLPKVRESAPAKPHHANAHSDSRNSQMESYGSNDMAHTYFLEEDRKKTEERNMIPIPRDLAIARNTPHS
ncbi:ribonuclease H-like domain-containing protein [Tanacetum coccineum]